MAKLQLNSLPLTTADTVFFGASMFNVPNKLDLPGGEAGNAGFNNPGLAILRGLGELGAKFKEHDITLDTFRAAFGNEASLQIDWPTDAAQPTLVASLNVRDPAAAGKFVDNFTAALSTDASWETTHADGLTFRSMDVPNVAVLSPTLTVTPKHLLLGLNLPEVKDAAAREKTATANFTATDSYKAASGKVEKPNKTFAYLDSKSFFERFYGTLKPYALTASFLLPQINDYVDLSKLPETDVIARHLSPTVLSETYTPDGCLLESVGTFTIGEAAVVVIGGSLGAATGFVPKPQTGGTGFTSSDAIGNALVSSAGVSFGTNTGGRGN